VFAVFDLWSNARIARGAPVFDDSIEEGIEQDHFRRTARAEWSYRQL
jgi:hypothetical protein